MSFENFVDDVWSDESVLSYSLKKSSKQLFQIFHELNHVPQNVLSCGWKSSAAIALEQQGILVDYTPESGKQYDTVLALDEYFTYFSSEDNQRDEIMNVASLVSNNGIMISSVRDYRNNPVHKRHMGDTSYININNANYVLVEINTPNAQQNQQWSQVNFVIHNGEGATAYEIGDRRTLYFKQLAKYCKDAGSKQFGVIKETFWKAPWKRTTEHITWTRF